MSPSEQDRRVVKSRRSRTPGRVVRIPLDSDRCGYGRLLVTGAVAYYDRQGVPGEAVDLLDLVQQPVAFTVSTYDWAFTRRSGWELLDVVTPNAEERNAQFRAVMRPPTGELLIYWSDPQTGKFGTMPASPADCEGLEILAVWEPTHVEERLRAHFDGLPDRHSEAIRALVEGRYGLAEYTPKSQTTSDIEEQTTSSED